MPMNLVLGTHNAKKLAELRELLPAGLCTLRSLAECDDPLVVEETGNSFAENAALKATVQARHLDAWVLGEDSGLSVEALSGAPGIYSARFAGAEADDEANNRRLLQQMEEVPDDRRGAHYTCQLCLSDPQGNVRLEATGYCHGRIVREPRGEQGFGYDPLFEIPEYHRTFGQLGGTVKRVLSHRARALQQFRPRLERLIASMPRD